MEKNIIHDSVNLPAPADADLAGTLKNVRAVTMVRNDRFLQKWVDYYGSHLGIENLYIFFDGTDQEIPEFCAGANTCLIPKMQGTVVETERERSRFVSERAAELMSCGADMVIATDADEFLVVDPDLGVGLREFLSNLPDRPCHSGLGVDVLQHMPDDKKIDFSRPFLQQRSRGWLYSRYTKPSIITRPLVWGSGFHRVKGENFHIAEGLYLFHFGGVDAGSLIEISKERPSWKRHQLKRLRTLEKISRKRAGDWDKLVRTAGLMQTLCRPVFAINKPTTFGLKFVAIIPERFKNLV